MNASRNQTCVLNMKNNSSKTLKRLSFSSYSLKQQVTGKQQTTSMQFNTFICLSFQF